MSWLSPKKPSLLVLCLLVCFAGCAKQPVEDVVESKDGKSSVAGQTQSESQVTPTAQTLTGLWYGEATLDGDKLRQKINGLPQAQQQLALAKANSFLSTVMAIDFRSNGTVENEVEIQSVDGQTFSDHSVGSWKVVESRPEGLVVETNEKLPDGTLASSQLFYQFLGDKDHIAIAAPVGEELSECDSYIVFERRTIQPVNVAQGMSATQTK